MHFVARIHILMRTRTCASRTRDTVCSHTQALIGMKGIEFDLANRMVENVITTISIPVGVATNMIVDGVERL